MFNNNEQFWSGVPITYIKTWDMDNDGKVEIMLEATQGNFNSWELIGNKFSKTTH
jgi:hypothetical protein